MQTRTVERRTRRSEHAQQALHYQLERVREKASLDALVLATAEGLPIAHSGDDQLCAELAALSPYFRLENRSTEPESRVRTVSIQADAPMFLVFYSRGVPPQIEPWAEYTHRGIKRILALSSLPRAQP